METIVGVVSIVGLLGGLWIIRTQAKEIDTLQHSLEIEQEWCSYWQKRAMEGDDRIEALTGRVETLQALYAERTQQVLVKNSYLIGAYGRAKN